MPFVKKINKNVSFLNQVNHKTKTRAKLVALQRMGLLAMSKVKLEVPVRSKFRKSITIVTETKEKKSNSSWYDLTNNE